VSSGKYYFPFVVLLVFVTTFLSACNFSTQSRYNYSEVGKIQVVKFGTVVKLRDIDIVARTSPLGAMAGGAAGAVGGAQIGSGSGSVAGAIGGAVGGMLVGAALEQAIRNRGGVEYTVVLENGKTLTVAQNISEKDVIHKIGDRVIVQINGQYQRVLPANDLPTEIERPKGIKFKNE
jgi:outer membrane lipoprotein SlyB